MINFIAFVDPEEIIRRRQANSESDSDSSGEGESSSDSDDSNRDDTGQEDSRRDVYDNPIICSTFRVDFSFDDPSN